MKKKKEKMHTHTISTEVDSLGVVYKGFNWNFPPVTLQSFSEADSLAPTKGCPPVSKFTFETRVSNKKEGNNPMNYATATVHAATTETQDQRKYLQRRLEDIYIRKERPLYAAFGLTDDVAPSTPKELKARIADGKFTIIGLPKDEEDEDDFDDCYYGGWSRLIRWRDPAKKADQDGYDAARKALQDEFQKAMDTIKIDDVKAGLEAVKALEAWEPTGAAN